MTNGYLTLFVLAPATGLPLPPVAEVFYFLYSASHTHRNISNCSSITSTENLSMITRIIFKAKEKKKKTPPPPLKKKIFKKKKKQFKKKKKKKKKKKPSASKVARQVNLLFFFPGSPFVLFCLTAVRKLLYLTLPLWLSTQTSPFSFCNKSLGCAAVGNSKGSRDACRCRSLEVFLLHQ